MMWGSRWFARKGTAAAGRAAAAAVLVVVIGAIIAIGVWRRAGSGGGAPAPPAPFAGSRASIVLVTIDTLRADRLGIYGSSRGLTPAMDALAASGVRFDAAIAQVPLTVPSHATIFTGAHPARHGVRTNDGFRLSPSIATLPEVVRSRGYATAAFVGGFPVRAETGLARGFDVYDDRFLREPVPGSTRPPLERRADDVVDAAIRWLGGRRGGQPFLVWLHLFDPHTPYEPPAGADHVQGDHPYDGEVRYTDRAVGRFIDRLRDLGVLEEVVVVLTADHGESLGEHGERTHGTFLYDATIRVPLIVRLPGRHRAGMAITVPVETADIAPTLAAVAGAAFEDSLDGRSLLPLIDGAPGDAERATYAESYYQNVLLGWSPLRAIRTGRWKFVEAPRAELYDLQNDPAETTNLIQERTSLATALAAQLPEAVAPGGSRAAETSTPVARDAAERLRSLGYVSGRTIPAAGGGVDPKDRIEVWSRLEDGIDRIETDPAGARHALLAALALEPQNGLALKYLGDLSYRAGRHREAVDLYRRAIEAGFVHPDVFVNLSSAARRVGDVREARRALEAAVRVEHGSADLWNELGIIRATAGDDRAAREAFARAMDADPARAEPHYNLALVLRPAGEHDAAMAALQAAVQRNPAYAEAHFEIGNVHLAGGNAVQALASYQAALAARPDYPEALFGAARAAEIAGRVDDARVWYERFIEVAPAEYRQHLELARTALARLRRPR